MPNIREYDAGKGGFSTSETGTSARAGAARRVGSAFNELGAAHDALARETAQLGHETEALGGFKAGLTARTGAAVGSAIGVAGEQAVKYLDHQQIAQGARAFAGLAAAKTEQWNEIAKNADPNDPTIQRKFMEDSLEPDLDKFRQGFLTERSQAWAEGQVEHLRSHMFQKTTADMTTLAGQAAAVNNRQTVNALSNTVRGDPSSLDFSLRTLESATEGMISTSPNLTGTAAAKVRTELLQQGKEAIIKSAAMGYVEKTGKVPEWATDPKFAPYINGVELKQFAQAAKYYQRLDESESRAARAQREHNDKLDFNTKINQLELDTMPKNAGDKPTLPADYWDRLREYGKLPGAALEPGRLKTMVQNGEAITERLNKPEPPARVSQPVYMALSKKIAGIDGPRLTDEREIFDASDKLTVADFNRLRSEFAAAKTPEGESIARDRGTFTKSFARLIDGLMNQAGVHSVLGTQRMYEFEMDARRREADLRKAGKDPHLVYDPSSEYYFGKPENIAKYRVSMQEAQAYEATIKSMDKGKTDAPAATTAKTVALPPVDERKKDQVYPTPRGPMKWTGTGWVAP